MSVAAISMVKDEADVIEGTLRHLAGEAIDEIIVADNGSTDGTRDLLSDLAHELPLLVLDDPDPAYRQSEKMSSLAALAADRGAEWIVPFDADELWIFHGDRLGPELRGLPPAITVARAELFNHFATAVDPPGKDPFETMVWRQPQPAPLPKVAFRWEAGAVIHQGNHGVTRSKDQYVVPGIEIRHFPYRSPEQMVRKARNGAAAYAATDLPEHVGAHWRSYGRLIADHGEEAMHDVFRRYFWGLSPTDEGWVLDPAPYMRWAA